MRFSKLTFFILFSIQIFSGQVKGDFWYFLDKSVASMYNDPKQSIDFSQNFLATNKVPDSKILLQNTIAQAYVFQGDYLNAVKSLPQKDDIIVGNTSRFYQFFINYCLADQFQNLGLYDQSQKTIELILKQKDFPQNPETQSIIGKIYQIKAINNVVFRRYNEAMQDFRKSSTYLTKATAQNEILRTENTLYQGICQLNLGNKGEAEAIFMTVLNGDVVKKYDILYAAVREYLARVKFLERKPDESVILLNEALQKIDNKNYVAMKQGIYEALSKAYLAQRNNDKYYYYQTLFNEHKAKVDNSKKAAISLLVGTIEEVNRNEIDYVKERKKFTSFIIVLSVIGLLIVLGFLYSSAMRKEKELNKQLEFFENFQLKNTEGAKEQLEVAISQVDDEVKKTNLLSSEKEKELLDKLEVFEKSERFLSNQMSLPVLAAELDTNIKYLSEIFKSYKKKKFNAYINDLRVQWIVNKLKTDPIFLNYKVSYLAEVSGFSSHSAFTAIFKSITGMSPNDFIQQINDLKKQ